MISLVVFHLLLATIFFKHVISCDSQDSNYLSLQRQLNVLMEIMAEYKAKLDRTEHMEERLRKAEQDVEKLERSLHLAKVHFKKSEKRIEQLEKELNTARQDFVYSDKGDKQRNENVNIPEPKMQSSINITTKQGQENWKTEGQEFTIAPKSRRSTKSRVAFSVYWSKCDYGGITLAPREIVPFDSVQLNERNGFDTNIHAFICPLTGTYFFTNTMAAWQHKVETEILLDGQRKAMLTTGNPHDENLQSSNSVLIHCQQNQRVWVSVDSGIGIMCASTPFTSFSGYLLWEDVTESS